MKIAYIIPSLANRGPVLVVKDLVQVMQLNGHQCTVFYFDDIIEVDFNCKTFKINFFTSINFAQYDVVHTHGLRPDIYVWLHKPLRYSSLFITTLHSFVFKDLTSQYNRFISYTVGNMWMRLFCSRHDKIIVLSNVAKEYYKHILLERKINVAYNTRIIDTNNQLSKEEENEILSYKKDGLIILGVNALLSPVKGIDLLIRAISSLDRYKLWIVGDGKSMSDLKKLTDECGVTSRVHFAGYKTDAFRYLPYYDVYMMPSRSEGFPLAILEAAEFQIPTVCSNIPIFKEIFSENEVVFFQMEDVESLKRAILCATNQKNMAEKMYCKFINCYSPIQFYNNHLLIYSDKK